MNYERCVSCCLAPQHNASALHLSAFRANDRSAPLLDFTAPSGMCPMSSCPWGTRRRDWRALLFFGGLPSTCSETVHVPEPIRCMADRLKHPALHTAQATSTACEPLHASPHTLETWLHDRLTVGACRQETGHWPNAFEYCRGKCRTTSRSTIHENAYLDPYHHCFSSSGKAFIPKP